LPYQAVILLIGAAARSVLPQFEDLHTRPIRVYYQHRNLAAVAEPEAVSRTVGRPGDDIITHRPPTVEACNEPVLSVDDGPVERRGGLFATDNGDRQRGSI